MNKTSLLIISWIVTLIVGFWGITWLFIVACAKSPKPPSTFLAFFGLGSVDANWVMAVLTLILALIGGVQLSHQRQNSKNQIRAYVTPVFGKEFDHPAIDDRLRIVLKNSGQTPALSVRTSLNWISFYGGNAAWPKNVPFEVKWFDGEGSRHALAAGSYLVHDLALWNLPDPAALVTALLEDNAGRRTVYIYGATEYLDVFNETHRTTFCLQRDSGGRLNDTKVHYEHNEVS